MDAVLIAGEVSICSGQEEVRDSAVDDTLCDLRQEQQQGEWPVVATIRFRLPLTHWDNRSSLG